MFVLRGDISLMLCASQLPEAGSSSFCFEGSLTCFLRDDSFLKTLTAGFFSERGGTGFFFARGGAGGE